MTLQRRHDLEGGQLDQHAVGVVQQRGHVAERSAGEHPACPELRRADASQRWEALPLGQARETVQSTSRRVHAVERNRAAPGGVGPGGNIGRVDNGRMSKARSVAGVVLAAGAGTRFGKPKVLAAQGEWLECAVSALAGGGCDDVVVVLGAAVVDVPAPARAVIAEDWSSGMSASVRAGLAAVDGADLAVLHLVDLPDVGPDVVARVLAAVAASPDTGLARATYDGRPGHPVVVAREQWTALAATLHGDHGARTFLNEHDLLAVECGDLASGTDVDYAG
jgi:nicotine blue oxidoreductase